MSIIALQDVESSQIAQLGHDPVNNVLAVRFKNWKGELKGLYHYQNVTVDDFAAFQNADSKGKHFGAHIKPFADKFPYVCIEKEPPADD